MKCIIVFTTPATQQESEINVRHIDEVVEEFGLSDHQAVALEEALRRSGSALLPVEGFSAVWRDFEASAERDCP